MVLDCFSYLDSKDANLLEYKLDTFSSGKLSLAGTSSKTSPLHPPNLTVSSDAVYKNLTGKDVKFEFPVQQQE